MTNEINWQDKIGEQFNLVGDKSSSPKYTVLGVDPTDNKRIELERSDSWTFTAVNPVINDDNSIEWEYSLHGRFTDEQRLQQHLNKSNSLQKLIDTGEHDNIVVYNKYGDFLAAGNPAELRKNGLWQLLDEPNAIVKETFPGITENKKPATCIVLSSFPPKDRSREELQAQVKSLLETADFSEFTDDDLKKQAIMEFEMRVNKRNEYIESARFTELRKEAEEIGSLWYVNEETGRICNVYFNPDSDAGGTFVECVIQADALMEVMEEPIKEFGEPVSFYFTDFFEGASKQTNVDINTPDFEVLLNELKDDIANKTYSFLGDTEETVQGVIEIAKKVIAPEKLRQMVKEAQQHVYMKSADHARENGEFELYSQSHGNNVCCIVDIGDEIKKNTTRGEMAGTSRVDTEKAFKDVVAKHSAERVCVMAALAVEWFGDDGRISMKNKLWASEISKPNIDWSPIIDVHATVVDGFVDKVREAYTKARDAFFEEKGRCSLTEIYDYIDKDVAGEKTPIIVDEKPAVNGYLFKVFNSEDELVLENWCETHDSAFSRGLRISDSQTFMVVPTNETYEDYLNRGSANTQSTQPAPEPAQNIILTEENIMNITARVTPIEDGTKLKGLATVSLGDQMDIHNIRIVHSDEKGLFLSMPGEMGKDKKFYESAVPASKEALAKLKDVVLGEYERTIEYGKKEKTEKSPEPVSLRVWGVRENNRDNNIKASCNVTVGETMTIKGVKVFEGKNGELQIGMPSKQNADGGYDSPITPRSPEFFAQVKAAVIEGYHNRDNIIGNTSYHKWGEEPAHKSLNSQFAEKVAVQLDADNVNWSGKVSGEKTSIAVSKDDAPKLDAAIEKTKTAIQEAKKAQENPPLPDAPPANRGGRK